MVFSVIGMYCDSGAVSFDDASIPPETVPMARRRRRGFRISFALILLSAIAVAANIAVVKMFRVDTLASDVISVLIGSLFLLTAAVVCVRSIRNME